MPVEGVSDISLFAALFCIFGTLVGLGFLVLVIAIVETVKKKNFLRFLKKPPYIFNNK